MFVQRNLYKNIWPILPGSEKKPDNWNGWKDGKKFALVLTHDVEHKKGYNRVEKLMQLEKELEFVSSFYFVPERDYKIENHLLDKIRQWKFEYGIHGLNMMENYLVAKRFLIKGQLKLMNILKIGEQLDSGHQQCIII